MGVDPEAFNPSTRSHGAWLRAALELESWADPQMVGSFVAEKMHERVAELRNLASAALRELGQEPPRRRKDDQ
jgi:hypothetical protein